MQGEPGTSTDGHIKDGSGRPVTPAANSSGGEALSRPALDNPNSAGSIMPAPLTSGEAAVATPAYVYAIGKIEPRFPPSRPRRNLRRRPDAPKRPGFQTAGRSTRSCHSAKIVTWRGNCAGS